MITLIREERKNKIISLLLIFNNKKKKEKTHYKVEIPESSATARESPKGWSPQSNRTCSHCRRSLETTLLERSLMLDVLPTKIFLRSRYRALDLNLAKKPVSSTLNLLALLSRK